MSGLSVSGCPFNRYPGADFDGMIGLAFSTTDGAKSKPFILSLIDQGHLDKPIFTVWFAQQNIQSGKAGGMITYGGFDSENCGDVIGYESLSSPYYYQYKLIIYYLGIRIAPLLAIVYLDHIEKTSLTAGILFYERYVDDVFVTGTTPSELAVTITNLKSKDVKIKSTVEEPHDDGFLPFLNTRVKIHVGKKEIRWYKKKSSKNIILHSRSAHPLHMKVNVVENLKKTSDGICTTDSGSDEQVYNILFENGYTEGTVNSWRPYSVPDGIALVLPFLNDSSCKKINTIVRNCGLPVRLIFQPPPTLKEMLTASRVHEAECEQRSCQYCREQKICHLRGTVYIIKCSGCDQRYVGKTERQHRKRLDEHRRAFTHQQSYPTNSFSKHRTTMHTREFAPDFKVKVLHRHLERPLERKIMKAKEIRRLRPETNSREELVDALKFIA
ncbi:hypothetical protein Y032_0006g3106 [Ancylostoma ceylanicum]|uniref:Uncharacterized protein n=1 Tax=Ancylostoma ceylanicum TaxID=53326 RepID=A0A016VQH1_9BILA|nr:hypothetical protein Y032_0006g3106 [Ancylostoma ceylanicum]